MRGGNFFYVLEQAEAFIVHRGVSQGGKKLSADKRKAFWEKNSQTVSGVKIAGGQVTISLDGLRELREKSLVVVSNLSNPRVWTPKRIMESVGKVKIIEETKGANNGRRGGLKL